jgi:signal transduction histidine kinase
MLPSPVPMGRVFQHEVSMNNSEFSQTPSMVGPSAVPREEFEQFINALTHEIRNRLNSIALEAADLAEQAGPPANAARLQQYVQDCSTYLKTIRETLAPDDAHTETVALSEFVKKLQKKRPQ